MNLTPEQRAAGKANFQSQVSRRGFLKSSVAAGVVAGGSLGAFYYGYDASHMDPIRVGVVGTGDEGNVLLGAINPDYVQVTSIADIRPYNVHRAFHGDVSSPLAKSLRKGLMDVYGWKTEEEARRNVKVYDDYRDLIKNEAKNLDAIIIGLPLHLHAPAAILAMQNGLHVLTEKLMGHSVHECKEMGRVADMQNLHLATGHQRHYNILYHEAMDTIQRGGLGDLHYIRAQWHRGNMPGGDSWQMPLPHASKPDDLQSGKLQRELASFERRLRGARGKDIEEWAKKVAQKRKQIEDEVIDAAKFGYQPVAVKGADGKPVYEGPAMEELIRWRLWDRTGGGLMVELGSHQLDASSIFISAMHGGQKQHPLTVWAAGNRPIFPADRDANDHIACMFEFPAPGYDPKDSIASRRKIAVQYASINGNGFGGYGETVYGTKGTLILEKETDVMLFQDKSASKVKVDAAAALDTQASGAAQEAAATGPARKVSRGYREEIEHWAWCIKNPAPENHPHCYPKVALADAVIALTTNISAKEGRSIHFKPEWFDINSDETPEGVKPDLSRYA
jgi:predicted dehydrogenase